MCAFLLLYPVCLTDQQGNFTDRHIQQFEGINAPVAGAVKEAISEVFSRQAWRKKPATSHAAAFRSAGDIWSTELCGTFASRTMYFDTTCARSLTDSS